jgi:hypothetical protein
MPTTTLKKLKLSTFLHKTKSVAIYKEKILIIGCIPFSLLYFYLRNASIFKLIHTSICHLAKINNSQLSIYPTTLVAFNTNYIIATNVLFKKYFLKRRKIEGKYSIKLLMFAT